MSLSCTQKSNSCIKRDCHVQTKVKTVSNLFVMDTKSKNIIKCDCYVHICTNCIKCDCHVHIKEIFLSHAIVIYIHTKVTNVSDVFVMYTQK